MTRAAEEARSARRHGQNRRQVQKGGVLYAAEAHKIVKEREDSAVEKAEKQLKQVQKVQKKKQQAEYKAFITKVKARIKEIRTIQANKKKVSQVIVSGIKRYAKLSK